MSIKDKSENTRYLTHMAVFPDDTAIIEQLPFVHSLEFETQNWQYTIFHHQDDAKAMITDLKKKGECRCETPYPPGGISAKIVHIYKIEDEQRPCGTF